ncbi:MAG TPA: type II secretion system protein [Vicinamibacterales bacterium]|nr:type II secretion system protein [Vicinamibacterales bacterium]
MGIRVRAGDQQGYAMAALLVAMGVMAVWWSVALPVWSMQARREKEAELIFRGEQYARAIAMFQRRYGNAIPPSIDVLLEQRFLRKRYKDPVTGDDFEVIGPGSPALAQAAVGQVSFVAELGARARGAGRQSSGPEQRPDAARTAAEDRARALQLVRQAGSNLQGAQRPPDTARGSTGVIGVRSQSTAKSLRVYNGADNYNEWLFRGTQQSTRPTAPPGSTPTPGGPVVPGRGGFRGQSPQQGSGADGRGFGPGRRGRGGFEVPRRGGAQPLPGMPTFAQPGRQRP